MQAHILIVDDDLHARLILGTHIRRMGCEVIEARNGFEALDLIKAIPTDQTIDLVITDVWMPGMSGIELMKSIRHVAPDLPVAMISAKATLESSLEAINGGAYAYITKPFLAEDVRDVVARGLRKAEEAQIRNNLARYKERLAMIQAHLGDAPDSPDLVSRDVLTDLISGLRHELGNMATAIKLNLEMIEERGTAPADLRANLDDLEATADELVELLTKFKEYPTTTRPTDILDLCAIVAGAVDALLTANPNLRSRTVVMLPDHMDVCIEGAASELNRVVVHLLENALRATERTKGKIFVSLTVSGSETAPYAMLVFEDEGPGFDNLTLEKPFSPSYTTRVDDGFVRGLGLGLFISRLVISLHNGQIHLENRSEGGARVEIQLPLIDCFTR